MNQITRTPEPSQQRVEPQRAPRGEELQQASNQFAELLAKERKETKSLKSSKEKSEADGLSGECRDAEGRTGRGDGLPYGIRVTDERGQGSQPEQHQQQWHAEAAEPAADDGKSIQANEGTDQKVDFIGYLGPPKRTIDSDPGLERTLLGPPKRTVDPDPSLERTLLGPPIRTVDPDPRFESLIQSDKSVNESSETGQMLPTPGDLMLQAFAAARIETPVVAIAEPTAPAASIPHADVDAIRELGEQIAERILVSRSESAGSQEMLIQLKDSAVAGTEVRMLHNGERLQVTLVTDNASSFHLLAARQADLQSKLGDAVVIQLSFDPEGMISQQRMERPLAAESSQQSGNGNRDRDADDRRRDPRRDQRQDADS